MRNRIFVLLSMLVLVAGGVFLALGKVDVVRAHFQHGSDGPRHMAPEMIDFIARELGLSETQKAEVKTLIENGHKNVAAINQKAHEVRKQIEAAGELGQFDEVQIRALATQQAQLMIESTVEHERTKSKIFSLLTAEQRAKAIELHKRHRQQLRGHGSH